MKVVKRLDEIISVILLITLSATTLIQVLCRFVFSLPLDWSEEVTRYVLITMIYLSTALTIRENKTIRIEIIDILLKGKPKVILDAVINAVCAIFMMFVAYQTTILVRNAFEVSQTSPSLRIPLGFMYGMECFMFVLMSLMFVKQVIIKLAKLKRGIN